jgi:hypothetical protein
MIEKYQRQEQKHHFAQSPCSAPGNRSVVNVFHSFSFLKFIAEMIKDLLRYKG